MRREAFWPDAGAASVIIAPPPGHNPGSDSRLAVAETTAASRQAGKWYDDDSEGGSRVSPTVEVQGLSRRGLWLLVGDTEYYLPYDQFPCFAEAPVRDAYEVELLHDTHLYWPELDIDLDLDSLRRPDDYPLIYR